MVEHLLLLPILLPMCLFTLLLDDGRAAIELQQEIADVQLMAIKWFHLVFPVYLSLPDDFSKEEAAGVLRKLLYLAPPEAYLLSTPQVCAVESLSLRFCRQISTRQSKTASERVAERAIEQTT